MENKLKKTIEDKIKKLLEQLGTSSKVSVKEDTDSFLINIDSESETGLLIGKHGETINAIQTVLALSLREELVGKKIIVNVGDWREKQEEKLKEMADQISQRAVETGQPQPIYNLTPTQRRIVHLALSESKDVETESTGEGEERYLLVKPKKNK